MGILFLVGLVISLIFLGYTFGKYILNDDEEKDNDRT